MLLLGELITELATKAGVPSDSESLKQAVTQINALTIEDDLASGIKSGLMSLNDAKNHPQVKGHFFAQFSDAVDSELETNLRKVGLSDEELAEVKQAEKSTFKRISAYTGKIKALQDKMAQATKADDPEKYKKFEAELNEQKALAAQAIEASRMLEAKYNEERTDWQLQGLLSKHEISPSIPEQFRGKIAREALSDFLRKQDAKIVYDNGQLVMRRASDPSLAFPELDAEKAVSRALAEANLLKKAEPPKPANPASTFTPAPGNDVTSSNFEKARQMSGF
jgi:hypothetical protein